jgi:hypothetical protein
LCKVHAEETASESSDVSCLANIENMLAVIYSVNVEAQEDQLVDFKFVEKFLKLTQDRLEYLYNTLLVIIGTFTQSHKPTSRLELCKSVIQDQITPLVL